MLHRNSCWPQSENIKPKEPDVYAPPNGLTKEELLRYYGTSKSELEDTASYWVVSRKEAAEIQDPAKEGHLHVVVPDRNNNIEGIAYEYFLPPPAIRNLRRELVEVTLLYLQANGNLSKIPRWIRKLFKAL
jgi:hypothetical protein